MVLKKLPDHFKVQKYSLCSNITYLCNIVERICPYKNLFFCPIFIGNKKTILLSSWGTLLHIAIFCRVDIDLRELRHEESHNLWREIKVLRQQLILIIKQRQICNTNRRFLMPKLRNYLRDERVLPRKLINFTYNTPTYSIGESQWTKI